MIVDFQLDLRWLLHYVNHCISLVMMTVVFTGISSPGKITLLIPLVLLQKCKLSNYCYMCSIYPMHILQSDDITIEKRIVGSLAIMGMTVQCLLYSRKQIVGKIKHKISIAIWVGVKYCDTNKNSVSSFVIIYPFSFINRSTN